MPRTLNYTLRLVLWVVCVVCAACAGGRSVPSPDQGRFDALSQDFLQWYLALDPVRATELGVHDWDDRLPDVSATAMEAAVAEWRGWLCGSDDEARGR